MLLAASTHACSIFAAGRINSSLQAGVFMTRKVVTRAPHREVGIVNAGWLLDHPVQHESHLERRFIMAALSCPVVRDIAHQPFTLALEAAGATGKYTPDFLITFADSSTLVVEVKPQAYLKRHESRLHAAAQALQLQGHPFFLATDALIDGHGLSARAMLLMRYGRMPVTEERTNAVLQLLSRTKQTEMSAQALVEQGATFEEVWAMVARHQWHVPADFRIDVHQTINATPYTGDCHDHFLSWFGAAKR